MVVCGYSARSYICGCIPLPVYQCVYLCVCVARRPGILELMHNLDYCDVLVIGEELDPEQESLEIHHSSLLGKHLDATNSTSGISIYGMVDHMSRIYTAICCQNVSHYLCFTLYYSDFIYCLFIASSSCFI